MQHGEPTSLQLKVPSYPSLSPIPSCSKQVLVHIEPFYELLYATNLEETKSRKKKKSWIVFLHASDFMETSNKH